MSSLNTVFLAGNLTRDPDLRRTKDGATVAHLGIAVNEAYKNRDGEVVETTCFADVDVWGKQAEACDNILQKGAGVLIEGKLQLDRWQTVQGEKRQRLKVRARRVQFIGRGARNEPPEGTPMKPTDDEALPF